MRNDLAIHAVPGSVTVPELFGIYAFPQVFQMISTVQATLAPDAHWSELLQHAFPMGSMTGAPKRRVMELTEQYEESRRGLYAGSVGYISPEGDFDFNVVIRSLQYNSTLQTLSFQTGGAITYDSDPEGELQESLLKARALREVVEGLTV
jgi:para-aminobenzoate synthetase component 1